MPSAVRFCAMSSRSPIAIRVIAAALWAVLALAFTSPAFLLCAVPLLVLVALLAIGRFPGEELLAEIRERRSSVPRGRVGQEPAAVRRPAAFVRPVGRAATFALAMRPPPALVLA